MKKLLISLALTLGLVSPALAEVWQARYGVAETFNFKLYNADGTLDVDEADGGTEVSLSCNEGAETTATNDFADEGTFYSIALTASEMQCERIAVVIAATTTEVFFIQTFGNASALTPSMATNMGASDFQAGAIDASAIAADAIGASELASNAIGAAEIADGAIDGATFSCPVSAGTMAALGIIDCGTAQAATSTTLQLRSAAAFADDEIIGATCLITGGSAGVGQSRAITDYVSSTDTATVATWTTTPTGTITYTCFGTSSGGGSVSIAAGGITSASFAAGAIDASAIATDAIGAAEVAASAIGASEIADGGISATEIATDAIDADAIAASAVGASEIATDAIGAAEIASAAIAADEIASDAIGAAEIATDAIGAAEIASAAIAADEIATDAIGAAEVAASAIGASEIATDAIDADAIATDAIGTAETAIIDVNVEQMNGVTVLGAGTEADPWNGE
jgi:hypothetical protein